MEASDGFGREAMVHEIEEAGVGLQGQKAMRQARREAHALAGA
jgi:hypothetical protein